MSKVAVERIEEYTTGVYEETAASIKSSGKTFKMLVRNIYTNPVLAPTREIIHNHLDEHKRIKLDQPIQITVPTYFDPTWRSRDYGESMSPEFMMSSTSGFLTLGESRKEGDLTQAGMWGVGSKTPLAYTDQFTVKCFKKHHYRTYLIKFKTFDGPDGSFDTKPVITFIDEGATPEPDGTEVSWAVNTKDISRFEVELTRVLAGMFDATFPVVIKNGEPVHTYDPKFDILQHGPDWRLFATNPTITRAYVRVSNILYPLDGTALPRLKAEARPLLATPLVIDFGTADLHIQPSRDGLEYSDKTVNAIEAKLQDLLAFLVKDVQTEIDKCPNFWSAQKLFTAKMEGQTKTMRDIFVANVVRDGRRLTINGHVKLPEFMRKVDNPIKARVCTNTSTLITRPMSYLQLGKAEPFTVKEPFRIYVEDALDGTAKHQSERIRMNLPTDKTQILWLRGRSNDSQLLGVIDHFGLPDDQVIWANKLPAPPVLPKTGRVQTARSVEGLVYSSYNKLRIARVLNSDPNPWLYIKVPEGDLRVEPPKGGYLKDRYGMARLIRLITDTVKPCPPIMILRPREFKKVDGLSHWSDCWTFVNNWIKTQHLSSNVAQALLDYRALHDDRLVKFLVGNRKMFEHVPDIKDMLKLYDTTPEPPTTQTSVHNSLQALSAYFDVNLSTPTTASKTIVAKIEALTKRHPLLSYVAGRDYYSRTMGTEAELAVKQYLAILSNT